MAKTVRDGGQIPVCPLPLSADTYRGCSGGCAFCFARSAKSPSDRRKESGFRAAEPREDNYADLLGDGIAGRLRRRGLPVHLGGMADPLQPIEDEEHRTLAFLRFCAENAVPVVLSTKYPSRLLQPALREAWEALPSRVLQVSVFDHRPEVLRRVESAAEPLRDRLVALEALSESSSPIVRMQPYVLPWASQDVRDYVHTFAGVGVRGIVAEGFKLATSEKAERRKAILNVIGKARGSLLIPEATAVTDKEYGTRLKRAHLTVVRDACHAEGLRFYAGDNDLRHMGDSLVCCGTEGLPGMDFFPASYGHMARIARTRGEVRWSDFEAALGDIADQHTCFQTTAATARAIRLKYGKLTVGTQSRHRWSGRTSSPAAVMPQFFLKGYDDEGDAVYGWKAEPWDNF